ncbi:hypothetical protein HYW42_00015 [Candidatus Daviesbacteria bacterium]|nr:hypothetical protein [Candidatus Daviesbacteria bacterium]
MKYNRLTNIFIIATIVGIITIPSGSFLYTKYAKPSIKAGKPGEVKSATTQGQVVTKTNREELVKEVSKSIDLPTDEKPVVATITEIEKLKNQPFFQKAKNGDKVLVYQKNKKAYLYDPVTQKVLDIIPINMATPSGITKTNFSASSSATEKQ